MLQSAPEKRTLLKSLIVRTLNSLALTSSSVAYNSAVQKASDLWQVQVLLHDHEAILYIVIGLLEQNSSLFVKINFYSLLSPIVITNHSQRMLV